MRTTAVRHADEIAVALGPDWRPWTCRATESCTRCGAEHDTGAYLLHVQPETDTWPPACYYASVRLACTVSGSQIANVLGPLQAHGDTPRAAVEALLVELDRRTGRMLTLVGEARAALPPKDE